MVETLLQVMELVIGAVLLGLVVWIKYRDVDKLATTRMKPWTKIVAEIALSYIAIAAVLDPLVPGFPVLTVHLPSATVASRLLEHLRLRVTPVGLRGVPGGNRVTYASFDSRGKALIVPEMSMLETHVNIEVFDLTQPTQILDSATVYISPFAKRQITEKTVTLGKE